ncbi:MAG TPA: hypothetical protein VMH83_06320, partial [Candidatus Acidoferrum sp.]|nr:hypothetical protein [Candidatus Acidoferrum sp.]
MEYAIRLVDILAWPITVLIVTLVLRSPLVQIIPLIKKLKYKDFEVEFERRVNNLSLEVERSTNKIAFKPGKEKELSNTQHQGLVMSPKAI